MRWRAKFEGVDHASEFFVDQTTIVASQFKSFVHDLRFVVSYRTRGEFDTVADNVILESQDVEWIHGHQCVHFTLGHGKWIMAKDHFFFYFVEFVHWKVDDPTEFERILFDKIELNRDSSTS